MKGGGVRLGELLESAEIGGRSRGKLILWLGEAARMPGEQLRCDGVAGKCVNRMESGDVDSEELKLLGSLAGSLVAMRFVVDHAGVAVRIFSQAGGADGEGKQFAFSNFRVYFTPHHGIRPH